MPRPNHDVPSLLIGGVKDFARNEDITVDEAHAELLARGLKNVGIMNSINEHAASRTDGGEIRPEDSGNDSDNEGSKESEV